MMTHCIMTQMRTIRKVVTIIIVQSMLIRKVATIIFFHSMLRKGSATVRRHDKAKATQMLSCPCMTTIWHLTTSTTTTMKLQTTLIFGALALTIAQGSAATRVFNLTGATAFRAAANNSILQMLGGSGVTEYAYTGTSGTRSTSRSYDTFDRPSAVTDGFNKTLRYIYDANGTYQREWLVEQWKNNTQYYPDIAVDAEAKIVYVTISVGNELAAFDLNGAPSPLPLAPPGKLRNPSSLVISQSKTDRRLLVLNTVAGDGSDPAYSRVSIYPLPSAVR